MANLLISQFLKIFFFYEAKWTEKTAGYLNSRTIDSKDTQKDTQKETQKDTRKKDTRKDTQKDPQKDTQNDTQKDTQKKIL